MPPKRGPSLGPLEELPPLAALFSGKSIQRRMACLLHMSTAKGHVFKTLITLLRDLNNLERDDGLVLTSKKRKLFNDIESTVDSGKTKGDIVVGHVAVRNHENEVVSGLGWLKSLIFKYVTSVDGRNATKADIERALSDSSSFLREIQDWFGLGSAGRQARTQALCVLCKYITDAGPSAALFVGVEFPLAEKVVKTTKTN
jgi:hypothetical protein